MLCSAGRDMLDPPEIARYCDGGTFGAEAEG